MPDEGGGHFFFECPADTSRTLQTDREKKPLFSSVLVGGHSVRTLQARRRRTLPPFKGGVRCPPVREKEQIQNRRKVVTMQNNEKLPNYLTALFRIAESGTLRPGAHIANVMHDGWCAIFRGKPCNCNPTISTTEEPK